MPREQRERERAERHAQRASAQAAAAAAAAGQGSGPIPPSPAVVRGKEGRQSDLPSASNVAVAGGRTSLPIQPSNKRQSSSVQPVTGTPGVRDTYASNLGGYGAPTTADSGRYQDNGYLDSRAATNQSVGGQTPVIPPGTSTPLGMEDNRRSGVPGRAQSPSNAGAQQQGQQGYMDHDEEEGREKKGGFAKFMEILTCRCA